MTKMHRRDEVVAVGEDLHLQEINTLTEKIIGCAIRVHKQLGAGFLEAIYESALCVEFDVGGLRYQREVAVPIKYRGKVIGEHRLDLVVEDSIVVELKSVERMDPVFEAQVLTYLRISGKKVGLLINFNSRTAKTGDSAICSLSSIAL
jgi:GxxExxY protein